MFIPGLVIGRLFDMGIYKLPIFLASVMLVVCTILVAQCTEFWQLLLCQGIAVGVSRLHANIVVVCAMLIVVSSWRAVSYSVQC